MTSDFKTIFIREHEFSAEHVQKLGVKEVMIRAAQIREKHIRDFILSGQRGLVNIKIPMLIDGKEFPWIDETYNITEELAQDALRFIDKETQRNGK